MTTEEKLQAILNAMPLSTDGINNAMNEPYQFVDKLGITAVIDEIMDRMPGSGASNPLPAPTVDFVIYATGDKGLMKLTTGYSEMGSVKVVMANGRAPELTDPEVTPEGTLVEANGIYQIAAIQQDITYPQGSSLTTIKEVNNLKCQKPTFSLNEDTGMVTLACATTGAVIRYTTDGSDPTSESTQYSAPFAITDNSVIKAKAFKTGILDSDIMSNTATLANIFGVMWDFGSPASALTRLTPDNDPLERANQSITTEPQPEIQGSNNAITQSGSSPFDAFNPWSGMKRRNFGDDGTGNFIPAAWQDELGFSTTKDTMVYIPKFWYKVVNDKINQLRYYYISDKYTAGFTVHPGSDSYISAFLVDENDNSVDTTDCTTNSPRFWETLVKSKGVGWFIFNIKQLSAIQMLYLIEYADFNFSEKIGYGDYGSNNSDTEVLVYHTGKIYSGDVRYRWISQIIPGKTCRLGGIAFFCGYFYLYNSDIHDILSPINISRVGDFIDLGATTYITKLMYDDNYSWLIGLPLEGGGSVTTFVTDKLGGSFNDGNCVAVTCTEAVNSTSANNLKQAGLFSYNNNTSPTSGTYRCRYGWRENGKIEPPVISQAA